MISVHSLLHYLVTFSLSKMDLTCPTKKQMALTMQCSAAAQDWNCLRTLSGCIQGGAYGRRPSTHCALTHAKHALLGLVGRRLGLLLSSEATMLLALLGLGASLSREDYRRRARKGLPGATQVSFSVQPLAIPGRCQQGTKRK